MASELLARPAGDPISPLETLIGATGGQIARCLAGRYVAILLIGAAARGESTCGPDGQLVSDLDFLVVLPQRQAALAVWAEQACRRRLGGLTAAFARPGAPPIAIGFASAVPRAWRLATPLLWEL
ncbi:MAG TPA: hypothetical protein VKY74_16280, partial [Chloroflexia bacterium]|nr:hypothetical protein [Chloroflexia bacterium]